MLSFQFLLGLKEALSKKRIGAMILISLFSSGVLVAQKVVSDKYFLVFQKINEKK